MRLLRGDDKEVGKDVLRPPWKRNFKPSVDGGDPAPVRWAVRPVGRTDRRELARCGKWISTIRRPGTPPKATKTAVGKRAKTEEFDLDRYPGPRPR